MTSFEHGDIDEMSDLEQRVQRMRTSPRIYDYCYFSTRTNRKVLLQAARKARDGNVVVDIGCGGKPFARIFNRNCTYIGFDWKGSNVPDVICDISTGIPARSDSADFVILSECLEHFPDPKAIIEETCRVLCDDGSIFISTPFIFPIHGRPYDYYRFTEYFYRHIAAQFGLKIDTLEVSNISPITPILDFQNIFLPTPFIPFFLKQILFSALNLLVFLPELIGRWLVKRKPDGRLAKYLRAAPVGYALILSKARQPGSTTYPENHVRD